MLDFRKESILVIFGICLALTQTINGKTFTKILNEVNQIGTESLVCLNVRIVDISFDTINVHWSLGDGSNAGNPYGTIKLRLHGYWDNNMSGWWNVCD